MTMRQTVVFLAVVCGALSISGCGRVRPYERETLSLRCMTPGVEIAEDRFRQHWQTSREGSEGGFAAIGGGCGCN